MNDKNDQKKTSKDVAQEALDKQAGGEVANSEVADSELDASNEVAETLDYLQNIIERNATELMRIKEELKLKRESLRSVFENDAQLAEAQEKASQYATEMKERKSQIVSSPQAVALKNDVGELNEEKKEIEATLSNHLLNYYAMTNSTSFDTSDGDQWEFNIRAAVKARKTG